MTAKAIFISCAVFIYAFAPAGLLPAIPVGPESLYILGAVAVVGAMVYEALR
jgi:hypothetical protein